MSEEEKYEKPILTSENTIECTLTPRTITTDVFERLMFKKYLLLKGLVYIEIVDKASLVICEYDVYKETIYPITTITRLRRNGKMYIFEARPPKPQNDAEPTPFETLELEIFNALKKVNFEFESGEILMFDHPYGFKAQTTSLRDGAGWDDPYGATEWYVILGIKIE